MRSLMQYVLTRTQKLVLVLLALLVLLAGWYVENLHADPGAHSGS